MVHAVQPPVHVKTVLLFLGSPSTLMLQFTMQLPLKVRPWEFEVQVNAGQWFTGS